MHFHIKHILTLLCIFLVVPVLSSAQKAQNKEFKIVYTGNINGKLQPTRGCSASLAGGLARRSTILRQMKEETSNIIILDNGSFFAPPGRVNQELRARTGLRILDNFHLTALNLGQSEFYFGTDYLAQRRKEVSFPFISTNIETEQKLPWLEEYTIKEMNGIKVGIVGILPTNAFSYYLKPEMVTGLTIIDPQFALERILPELKTKTDFIVLLSQLPEDQTTTILESLQGINLAIASSGKLICESPASTSQVVVPSGRNGQNVLSVTVDLQNGEFKIRQNEPILLDDSTAPDESVTQMINTSFKKRQGLIREAKKKAATQPNQIYPTLLSEDDFKQKLLEQKVNLKQKKAADALEAVPMKVILWRDGKPVDANIKGTQFLKVDPNEKD